MKPWYESYLPLSPGIHHFGLNEKGDGFSIKSFLGSNSTLFNAGAGTNFIYKIELPEGASINCDEFNAETYNCENKIGVRLNRLIEEYGANIRFIGTQSRCLFQNLRTIDGDLPLLLSELLLIRHRGNLSSSVAACTEALTELNPLDFDVAAHGQVYEYKIKRFLHDCALGMTPETPWQGVYDATGGQIVVRKDGEVVCYHIYELNRYMQYLYNNTKFENPSTNEDPNNPGHAKEKTQPNEKIKPFKYGWIYEEDGELRIKLNLQIRFK